VIQIRQCQPFIWRCNTTTIFKRTQSIQDIVITFLAPIYPHIVVHMIFHLSNKCFVNRNIIFFNETHLLSYIHKPTNHTAFNIHNILNKWSHEFWHIMNKTRRITRSWNQDRCWNRGTWRVANTSMFANTLPQRWDPTSRCLIWFRFDFFLLLWLYPFLEVETTLWPQEMLTVRKLLNNLTDWGFAQNMSWIVSLSHFVLVK